MMAPTAHDRKVVALLLEALSDMGLKPMLIPHGRIDELRGGSMCFDLKAGGAVDAAVLLEKPSYSPSAIGGSEFQCKVDYAVRGTVKGVLPRRVLSRTALELKGLLRRRIGLRWETPLGEEGDGRGYPYLRTGGKPPGPGELWEGGPYQELTANLNRDAVLMESLRTFAEVRRGAPLTLSVITDGWGESIRVRGNLWLRDGELLAVYATPAYLRIVERICSLIKYVRRSFGGLTF